MTTNEYNKFSMYSAIGKILENYATVTDSSPLLKESTEKFIKILEVIRIKDNSYLNAKKGAVEDKETAEEKLIGEILVKAGVMFVFARKTGNGNLKALTDVKRTILLKMRDTELLQRAKAILENLKTNQEELLKNGLTATSADEFESAIKDYEDAIGEKDAKQAEAKASRKDLKDLFDESDDILKNDIDRLMELVKDGNADFYNRFKAARTIKDLGAGKKTKAVEENKTDRITSPQEN
jgi:hypothetical protein